MISDTKDIITRESCKKVVKTLAISDLYSDAISFVILLLIFVPLILISIYIGKHILILGIAFIILCSVPLLIGIYKIILGITVIRLVGKNGFSIVKDTVCGLSKGEMPKRYAEGRGSVDVIYFLNFGRYVASPSTFGLCSVGDEFYLVILHTKNKKIISAFHSMIYDYKDIKTDL